MILSAYQSCLSSGASQTCVGAVWDYSSQEVLGDPSLYV